MPELGKATYVVEVDSRPGERGINRFKKTTHRAASDIDRDLSRMSRDWEEVTAGTRRASNEADRFGSSAQRASKRGWQWDNKLRQFSNTLSALRWPAILALGGPAIQSLVELAAGATSAGSALTSAAGGAVAMASALVPLGRASAIALNGLLGIGSAVGTLYLGFSGVFSALSAMNTQLGKSGKEGESAAKAQRSAAAQIKSANERIRNSEESLEKAHKSVIKAERALHTARREAVRDLQDLKFAAQESAETEKRAALSLEEARQAYAELTVRGSGATADERRSAAISIEEAELNLTKSRVENKRAHEDLQREERKGVSGSETMVKAREALAEANNSVLKSQRELKASEQNLVEQQKDSREALNKTGSAANTLALKMENLPAAGKKFVHFLFNLKPRLMELKQASASNLFPGVESGITSALKNFGPIKHIVEVTAAAMGRLAAQTGQLLGNSTFGSRLVAVSTSNARALTRVSRGALSLAKAFGIIAQAAIPLNEWLSKVIERWAASYAAQKKAQEANGTLAKKFGVTRKVIEAVGGSIVNFGHVFLNVMNAGVRSGLGLWRSVQKWSGELRKSTGSVQGRNTISAYFERSAESLRLVAKIAGHLLSVILNIGSTSRSSGMELLRVFNKATERWKAWTESVGGRNELEAYFKHANSTMIETGRFIGDLGHELASLGAESNVAPLIKEIRENLLPALGNMISNATNNLGPEIIKMVVQITEVVGQLSNATGGLKVAFTVVNQLLSMVNNLLSNELLRQMASWAIAFGALARAGFLIGKSFKQLALIRVVDWIRNIGTESQTAADQMVAAESEKTLAVEQTNAALEQQGIILARGGGTGPGGTTITGVSTGRAAQEAREAEQAAKNAELGIGGRVSNVKNAAVGKVAKYGVPAAGAVLIIGGTMAGNAVGGRKGQVISGAASGAGIGTMIEPGWGTAIGAAVGAFSSALISKAPSIGEKFATAVTKRLQGPWGRHIKVQARNRELGEPGAPGHFVTRKVSVPTRGGAATVTKKEWVPARGGSGLRGTKTALESRILQAKESGASDAQLKVLRQTKKSVENEIRDIEESTFKLHESIKLLGSGVITTMGDIRKIFSRNLEQIDQFFPQHGKRWRASMIQNMEAEVKAVKQGMIDGTISAKDGVKKLEELFRQIKLFKSEDPLGIAKGFKETWRNVGIINGREVQRAVHDLGEMKPKAREKAQDTMIAYARQLEKSGKLAEGSVSRLRSGLVSQFGQTNAEIRKRTERMTENLVGMWEEGSEGVIRSIFAMVRGVASGSLSMSEVMRVGLQALGANVNKTLTGFGFSKKVSFTLTRVGATLATAALNASGVTAALGGLAKGIRHKYGHATGGKVGSPMYMVGEEAPRHHEWVIATNPQYKKDNINYWAAAGRDLGVPGFAKGGSPQGISEPGIAGPEPLRSVGQRGFHKATVAAREYVDKQRGKAKGGSRAPFGLSGGLVASPFSFAKYMIEAGFPRTVKVISEGLGTILSESGFRVNNAQGPGGHIGPWAESPFFGSVKVREDPRGSTFAAYRKGWLPTRSFWQAWGQWEAEQSGLSGGGAGSYGGKFAGIAKQALKKFGGKKYAKGGLVGATKSATSAALKAGVPGLAKGGYAYPFQNASVNWGRVDQGVDFTGSGPIQAIGSGVVAGIIPNWYEGQPYVYYKLNEGPKAGNYVYVAEGISGYPSVGTHVSAGQTIAKFAHGTVNDSIETGWSTSSGSTAAAAAGDVNPSSHYSSEGQNFYGFLKQLASGGGWKGSPGAPESARATASTPKKKPMPKSVKGKVPTGGVGPGKGGKPEAGFSEPSLPTAAIQFGPMPKSIKGCTAELIMRRGQLVAYKSAVRRAKDPRAKKALEANVRALEGRIESLVKLRAQLIRAKKEAAVVKKIGHVAEFDYWNKEGTGVLWKLQQAWETAEEFAGRVMDVEPTEESDVKPYIAQQEEPAYKKILGIEGEWRNQVLGAEAFGNAKVTHWRERVKQIKEKIEEIQEWRKSKPEAYQKWKDKIPLLRTEMKAMQEAVAKTTTETIPGWESMLQGIQGLAGPRGPISPLPSEANPDAGFGGYIWSTQTTLRDLDIRLKEAPGKSAQEEHLEELYKQLATEARQREAVMGLQMGNYAELLTNRAPVPAYGGVYHSGGVVPGRPGEERTIVAQAGEIVAKPTSAPSTAGSAEASHHWEVLVEDGAVDKEKIKVVYRDQQKKDLSKSRRRI